MRRTVAGAAAPADQGLWRQGRLAVTPDQREEDMYYTPTTLLIAAKKSLEYYTMQLVIQSIICSKKPVLHLNRRGTA